MSYHRGRALAGITTESAGAGPAAGGDPNATALTVTAGDFDSTKIPGTCKPRSFPVLNLVQEFQRQLNRVAHVLKFEKVAVDGDVGPGSLRLFRQVQAASPAGIPGDASNCLSVAGDLDLIVPMIRETADFIDAPASVPGPITIKPPTIVAPNGTLVPKPSSGLFASVSSLPTAHKLVLAASVGGIIYVIATSRKRGRRRSA